MKYLILSLLLLASCSSTQESIINYRSRNIYDIQTDAKNIIYLCTTPGNKKEPRTFFNIYWLKKEGSVSFFSRRALKLDECKEWIEEMDEVMKDTSTVRLIGLDGSLNNNFLNPDLNARTNGKFSLLESSWFFSRVLTTKGCLGHFGGECDSGYDEKKLYKNP